MEVQIGAPLPYDNGTFACPINMVGDFLLAYDLLTSCGKHWEWFRHRCALQTLYNDGNNTILPSYVVDVSNGNYVGIGSYWGWESVVAINATIQGYLTQVWTRAGQLACAMLFVLLGRSANLCCTYRSRMLFCRAGRTTSAWAARSWVQTSRTSSRGPLTSTGRSARCSNSRAHPRSFGGYRASQVLEAPHA